MKMVLGMLFFTFSNVNIQFVKKELTSRTYTTEDALPTTYWIEFIHKKEFAKTALDKNIEAFLVYIFSLTSKIIIHLAQEAQIALLLGKKVTVPAEYTDFVNIFLKKSAEVLPERTSINEHAIKLEEGKQPHYRPIYSLGPIELETFKTYIKTNLANSFIQPSKFPAGAPILFDCTPNGSLRLCVNYQGLNYLTIKNRYLFLLIYESLDRLG